MILAAGFGSRLRPLSLNLPKPLFPIMNRSLLAHSIDLLKSAGIIDIAINLHYQPEKIMRAFSQGEELGVRLNYSVEEKILGTAGGIKAAQQYLDGGPFVVINSDILVDIDLRQVLQFHQAKGSCLTLVVRQDSSPESYDPIEIDADGRVVHFIGASSRNLPDNTSRVMFTGIQIMEPEIFERIPVGQFCGTAQDVFPQMIEEGCPVYGYLHQDYWIDTGLPGTYRQAHMDALDGKIQLKYPASQNPKGPLIVPPVMIGKNCRIAENAQVGPYAVLGNECSVRQGAVIEHSVCWDRVTLGIDATVQRSILGEGVVIDKHQQVKDQSLVSPR
jgi:NDP-sugar pyrophosphorylase family protein